MGVRVWAVLAFAGAVVFGAAPVFASGAIPGPYCYGIRKELRAQPMQFSLPRVDGGTLAFDNRSGEPIMLDFFATWCGPCNREMPDVLRLAHAYRERGLRVELIDVREKTAAVQAFVKRYGIDVPVALDADGTTFKHFLGLQAIPTAAFYTAKGILTCMETQELTWKELDNEASAALNGWMP